MWHLYLDESGDLGFNFADKNPSKYLTLCVLATSQRVTVSRLKAAVKSTLKNKVNRKNKNESELKGTRTSIATKRYFWRKIKDFRFSVYAMTLNKIRVFDELKKSPKSRERLYNYIARQVLDRIPFEKAVDAVELIVDKSKGRWEIAEFNKYIESNLEGRLDPRAPLRIFHRDSCADYGLSAVDLFCWGIYRKHEHSDEEWYADFRDKIALDERYL